ncbi:MAG: hypothetical protein ACFFCZ_17910 [Promethearchaeota archaeon]
MKRTKNDVYLKLSFFIGGIYNIVMGFILIFFYETLLSLFEIQHTEIIFVQTTALFLIVVGYLLIYAVQNPRKLAIIGMTSVVTRLVYFITIIFNFISQGTEIVYLLFGLIDGIIALIILIPLLLTEGVSWKQIWHF